MVEELILNNAGEWDNDISEIMFKIAHLCSLPLKKRVLKIMLDHCDKRRDLYYEVCTELYSLIKPAPAKEIA